MVMEKLGKPFEHKFVVVVRDLPRTRSGKILGSVIRGTIRGWELRDDSILENPECLKDISEAVEKLRGEID